MKDAFKKLVIAGTAALAGFALANRKRVKKEIDDLVKKGKITAKEGQKILSGFTEDAKKQSKMLEQKIKTEAGNIAKKTLEQARKQTTALEKKLKELETKLGPQKPKKAASKKKAVKKVSK